MARTYSNTKIKEEIRDLKKLKWYQKWWGQLLIIVAGGMIIAFFIYILGWN